MAVPSCLELITDSCTMVNRVFSRKLKIFLGGVCDSEGFITPLRRGIKWRSASSFVAAQQTIRRLSCRSKEPLFVHSSIDALRRTAPPCRCSRARQASSLTTRVTPIYRYDYMVAESSSCAVQKSFGRVPTFWRFCIKMSATSWPFCPTTCDTSCGGLVFGSITPMPTGHGRNQWWSSI
jgi:hypothetical protein